jgi:phosphotransferase system HPr (HPr) family protein
VNVKLSVRLPDALHARPANLLVRLASLHPAEIVIRKGNLCGSAKNILEVLSLGAARDDVVEIEIMGADAETTAAGLKELIERNFDADLVPEHGSVGVAGVAIGHAAVIASAEAKEATERTPSTERARAVAAFASVERQVTELVAALAPTEARLFEPEVAILRALSPRVFESVAAGESAEEAVRKATAIATTDLLLDARVRLLDTLGGGGSLGLEAKEDSIVVTGALTPSIVAGLPRTVVGIVAGLEEELPPGFTSHAAILARGRGIPLAFVPSHVADAITDGETVVIDTTEAHARVWVSPSEALLTRARDKRSALLEAHAEEERSAAAPLAVPISVRVNIGALSDTIPVSADGIGLLRTELLFAHRSQAPSEAEQLASVLAIARKTRGPLVARLFDAGGDKPLPWLVPPAQAPDARGIELLLHHVAVLEAQLRALGRAAESADVHVLLPLVRHGRDVEDVRSRTQRPPKVGAMVETPGAVEDIDAIAEVADFVCVGTNDLSAAVLGVDRADAALSWDRRVVALLRRIVQAVHARKKQVTVCGEMAGDERGATILVGLGVDALSVAPSRLAPIRVHLARVTRESSEQAAREALGDGVGSP